MNQIQEKITTLKDKGWSLAAIADELGVHWYTAQRWHKGEQYPDTPKPVLMALDALLKRKRIPKQRRYAKGSRQRVSDS